MNITILNRESLRVIRPTISRLIKLCLTIQASYKLEDDINLPSDKVIQGISTESLYQQFLDLNEEFEEKSVEIIDVVNPRIKKLIGIISQRAIAVKRFLPSKNASLKFYNQGGPNKALQAAMRDYLEDLGKI